MGQVSFHKESWDRYWGRAIQLKGSLSQSRKKIFFGQFGLKIRGRERAARTPPLENIQAICKLVE